MMKVAQRRGGVAYYEINKDSHFVNLLEQFNNCIIEHMLDEQTLYDIGDYWKQARSKPQPSVDTEEHRTIAEIVQGPPQIWDTITPAMMIRPVASFHTVTANDLDITLVGQSRQYTRDAEGTYPLRPDKVLEQRPELHTMAGA
jgi:hypothetical protein